MPDALILAFDTSAAHCAAALLSGTHLLAARSEEMGRGQAERLMPMLEEMLSGAGHHWRDLGAIGVGTGPGNFTGIRIAVAAARGLALGLNIPAIGVTGFEARALDAPLPVRIAIEAPRGQVFLQHFDADGRKCPPELRDATDTDLPGAPFLWLSDLPAAEIATNIAHIARSRLALVRSDTDLPRPAPLYLRPADARPAREAPPVILA